MARESAGSHHLKGRRSVRLDGQTKCRPRGRCCDLDERRPAHRSWCGNARSPSRGLNEAHRGFAHLWIGPQLWKRNSWKRFGLGAQLDPRGADQTATTLAEVGDASVLDLDPACELVREPERICIAQHFEVVEDIGGWQIVVGHTPLERKLRHPPHRFQRYPRYRGDL